MQKDFHYYATICASYIAGHTPEDSIALGYASQFTDCCTKMLLKMAGAPVSAATTQSQSELADARMDIIGLQDITRIWTSFHFLPRDLYADAGKKSKFYKNKFRLICGPNGPLAADTVELAKGKSVEAAGLAMHVIADTWAHTYFAGTPSVVINSINQWFYEIMPDGALDEEDGQPEGAAKERKSANAASERKIKFAHNPMTPDDPVNGIYINSPGRSRENSIMNLGHGRAGHLPDYSFVKYRYLPAWGNYEEIVKDNPSDYYKAFCQMILAIKYLRGAVSEIKTDEYDYEAALPYKDEIDGILRKRQTDASEDWKIFAEKLIGREIPDFDTGAYVGEYMSAGKEEKDNTKFGRYIIAALAQKSMVCGKIFKSRNLLAGYSVDFREKGFKGIRDFAKLVTGKEDGK